MGKLAVGSASRKSTLSCGSENRSLIIFVENQVSLPCLLRSRLRAQVSAHLDISACVIIYDQPEKVALTGGVLK